LKMPCKLPGQPLTDIATSSRVSGTFGPSLEQDIIQFFKRQGERTIGWYDMRFLMNCHSAPEKKYQQRGPEDSVTVKSTLRSTKRWSQKRTPPFCFGDQTLGKAVLMPRTVRVDSISLFTVHCEWQMSWCFKDSVDTNPSK
jgi:hypothetical protein